MDDRNDTLYESAERTVFACLRKAHRLHAILSPPSLPSLNRLSGGGCPTVPSDALCWLMDVERTVTQTGRRDNQWFVHRAAPDIVASFIIRGEKHVVIASRHGISRTEVGQILRRAIMSVALAMAQAGLEYEHKGITV